MEYWSVGKKYAQYSQLDSLGLGHNSKHAKEFILIGNAANLEDLWTLKTSSIKRRMASSR